MFGQGPTPRVQDRAASNGHPEIPPVSGPAGTVTCTMDLSLPHLVLSLSCCALMSFSLGWPLCISCRAIWFTTATREAWLFISGSRLSNLGGRDRRHPDAGGHGHGKVLTPASWWVWVMGAPLTSSFLQPLTCSALPFHTPPHALSLYPSTSTLSSHTSSLPLPLTPSHFSFPRSLIPPLQLTCAGSPLDPRASQGSACCPATAPSRRSRARRRQPR